MVKVCADLLLGLILLVLRLRSTLIGLDLVQPRLLGILLLLLSDLVIFFKLLLVLLLLDPAFVLNLRLPCLLVPLYAGLLLLLPLKRLPILLVPDLLRIQQRLRVLRAYLRRLLHVLVLLVLRLDSLLLGLGLVLARLLGILLLLLLLNPPFVLNLGQSCLLRIPAFLRLAKDLGCILLRLYYALLLAYLLIPLLDDLQRVLLRDGIRLLGGLLLLLLSSLLLLDSLILFNSLCALRRLDVVRCGSLLDRLDIGNGNYAVCRHAFLSLFLVNRPFHHVHLYGNAR